MLYKTDAFSSMSRVRLLGQILYSPSGPHRKVLKDTSGTCVNRRNPFPLPHRPHRLITSH
uniref:Uncharacterized protein n=1 Tax=Anguilla anguilla TaxID=7936 RepID=A0A0E9WY40_ANGAN